jgi:4-amino-4-deoxy-L-arabinose transferase-like glycosyltransferase
VHTSTLSPRRPRWEQPALLALLAGTAVVYLWNLSASGYANDFYAAAVQAGTQSAEAWLFGLLDSSNAITVDKPPVAIWVMTLSARLSRFNSWSLLVPQALMGVASAALLRAAVRRWAGPYAGLLAGGVLALTGRGADVRLRQPGRAAGAAAGRRGVRDGARGRRVLHARLDLVARGRRRPPSASGS